MIRDEYRSLDSLLPDASNYNRHSAEQVAVLASQVLAVGFTAPFLVADDGTICAGHRRRLALLKLRADNHAEPAGVLPGWSVPCRVGDWSEIQRLKVLIGDNPDPERLDYDTERLTALLAELSQQGELDGSGYDEARLEALIEELSEGGSGDGEGSGSGASVSDLDAIPEDPPTRTQFGDLWQLGDHLILIGDCTDPDNIRQLWGEESADIILTDPPYCSGGFQESGRNAGSTTAVKNRAQIARDNLTTDGLEALIEKAIGRLPAHGCCFVFCDWRQVFTIRRTVEPLGYQYRALIVWDKQSPGMGGPWRHQHELIYFGTRRKEPAWGTYGDVLACPRTGNEHHTTEKPVALMEILLRETAGDIVADPFLGSGTTLIACEQVGKRLRGMELEPRHGDTILARWEQATGKTAELLERV